MADCPDCNCSDFDKCLRILNLMLDEEATTGQEDFFYSHIEKCITCFSHYNVEKQLRQLLRSKLKKHPVPTELAREIRNRIVS